VRFWLLALLLGWLGWGAQAQQAADGFVPAKTWVFVVGVLEWQRSDVYPNFPKTNRRDTRLAVAYQSLGVPSEHVYLLLDRSATRQAIHNNLMEILGKSAPGDTLILYYAGHGYRQESDSTFWMVPYDGYDVDTLWGLSGLERDIRSQFKGSRVLLSADCCHSGCMWSLTEGQSTVSYFALTSSTAKLSSTGNWTFTDCVLDALAGEPRCDLDGDGSITLGEMAQAVERDMQFAEGQKAGGAGSTGFPPDTRWVKASRPLRPGEGEYVRVFADGAYWKARVVERGSLGVKVHWMGLAQDYPDDWVSPSRVLPWIGP